MADPDSIQIFSDSAHCPGSHQVVVHTVAGGIVGKKEFHPACPEQQAAEEAPQCLTGVTFHEHPDDDHRQSCRPHRESGVVQRSGRHGRLHYFHECMTQRHRTQYEKKGSHCLSPILFLFHIIKTYSLSRDKVNVNKKKSVHESHGIIPSEAAV